MELLPQELRLIIISYIRDKSDLINTTDLLHIKNIDFYTMFLIKYPMLSNINFIENYTINNYDWRGLYFRTININEHNAFNDDFILKEYHLPFSHFLIESQQDHIIERIINLRNVTKGNMIHFEEISNRWASEKNDTLEFLNFSLDIIVKYFSILQISRYLDFKGIAPTEYLNYFVKNIDVDFIKLYRYMNYLIEREVLMKYLENLDENLILKIYKKLTIEESKGKKQMIEYIIFDLYDSW